MANEDTALREVDQELAEERQWEMFRQHGPSIIAAAVAVVALVGGWQFWQVRQEAVASENALEFKNAVELLEENPEDGRAALAAIAESKSGGYGVLARLHVASSLARDGDRLAAVQAYRSIATESGARDAVQALARLRAAYLSLADGREAVIANLDGLDQEGTVNSYYAREILALAAFQAKDYETAHAMFTQATTDLEAPESIRDRAEEFAALSASGRAGVNLTGEARIEDLVDAIGVPGALDAGEIVDDGHDHSGEAGAGNLESAEAADNDPTDNGNE